MPRIAEYRPQLNNEIAYPVAELDDGRRCDRPEDNDELHDLSGRDGLGNEERHVDLRRAQEVVPATGIKLILDNMSDSIISIIYHARHCCSDEEDVIFIYAPMGPDRMRTVPKIASFCDAVNTLTQILRRQR